MPLPSPAPSASTAPPPVPAFLASPPRPVSPPGHRVLVAVAVAGPLVAAGCGGPTPEANAPTVPVLRIVTVTPGPAPTRAPGAGRRYVVQQGDTLSGIAEQFGVAEEALLRANALSDRNLLYAGQELTIPES